MAVPRAIAAARARRKSQMVLPTEEQQVAVNKFLTGRPLKIAAFAGAGKTTTLRMLARGDPFPRSLPRLQQVDRSRGQVKFRDHA